ncbi:glycoside hydrolase family 99-like domain-containing protein [Buttiauxella sp.]|uniref:glycoside hydrolase family 99-like domain-containing protein n=1 Tax=Buttiauxella sp. TaxID=1972222 RepID=UPI003C74E299
MQSFNDILNGSELFDSEWYKETYPDVELLNMEPAEHYLKYGWRMLRDPSVEFSTKFYLKFNADVKEAGVNPLIHYITQGINEGRVCKQATTSLFKDGIPAPVYIKKSQLDFKFESPVRTICFYLPQFHAIPENNEWWGDGFTEWSNVKPAKSQFEGHHQPHIPDELGYYNLLDVDTQRRQIALAKQYGIDGFCFYFYWFAGHRLLEQPLLNYLDNSDLDLPFSLCWANENWCRRWDGLESEILIAQDHSPADDIEFIKYVSKYMHDPRYIRVNGKPLLTIYRPSLLPDAKATVERWRTWCRENGIGEIYMAYTQSFEKESPNVYGIDAAIEFPPNNSNIPNITHQIAELSDEFTGNIYDWSELVKRSEHYSDPGYQFFRGVTPSWDNTARRKNNGTILYGSSPCLYQKWLFNAALDTTQRIKNPDERFVFINAWNEWAEGAHLEPDQAYGFGYLEATRMALVRAQLCIQPVSSHQDKLAVVIHAFYLDILEEMIAELQSVTEWNIKLFVTTPYQNEQEAQALLQTSGLAYHLLPLENRGRDVLPFLKIMNVVNQEGYNYLVKVHTKRSEHREDGDKWRDDLFSKLITSAAIDNAMDIFREQPKVGIIGPEGHIVPMNFYWGSNAEKVEKLCYRMGYKLDDIREINFVAGTMFFARVDTIKPLLGLGLTDDDFDMEAGQIDGTIAHAIERVIAVAANSVKHTVSNTNGESMSNHSSYAFAKIG